MPDLDQQKVYPWSAYPIEVLEGAASIALSVVDSPIAMEALQLLYSLELTTGITTSARVVNLTMQSRGDEAVLNGEVGHQEFDAVKKQAERESVSQLSRVSELNRQLMERMRNPEFRDKYKELEERVKDLVGKIKLPEDEGLESVPLKSLLVVQTHGLVRNNVESIMQNRIAHFKSILEID